VKWTKQVLVASTQVQHKLDIFTALNRFKFVANSFSN